MDNVEEVNSPTSSESENQNAMVEEEVDDDNNDPDDPSSQESAEDDEHFKDCDAVEGADETEEESDCDKSSMMKRSECESESSQHNLVLNLVSAQPDIQQARQTMAKQLLDSPKKPETPGELLKNAAMCPSQDSHLTAENEEHESLEDVGARQSQDSHLTATVENGGAQSSKDAGGCHSQDSHLTAESGGRESLKDVGVGGTCQSQEDFLLTVEKEEDSQLGLRPRPCHTEINHATKPSPNPSVEGCRNHPYPDLANDQQKPKTFCKDLPMGPESTWDFSLKALYPDANIVKHMWIEGSLFQQLEEQCFHELQNVTCECEEKIKQATCRLCHKVFCSSKCFKRLMKKITGEVQEAGSQQGLSMQTEDYIGGKASNEKKPLERPAQTPTTETSTALSNSQTLTGNNSKRNERNPLQKPTSNTTTGSSNSQSIATGKKNVQTEKQGKDAGKTFKNKNSKRGNGPDSKPLIPIPGHAGMNAQAIVPLWTSNSNFPPNYSSAVPVIFSGPNQTGYNHPSKSLLGAYPQPRPALVNNVPAMRIGPIMKPDGNFRNTEYRGTNHDNRAAKNLHAQGKESLNASHSQKDAHDPSSQITATLTQREKFSEGTSQNPYGRSDQYASRNANQGDRQGRSRFSNDSNNTKYSPERNKPFRDVNQGNSQGKSRCSSESNKILGHSNEDEGSRYSNEPNADGRNDPHAATRGRESNIVSQTHCTSEAENFHSQQQQFSRQNNNRTNYQGGSQGRSNYELDQKINQRDYDSPKSEQASQEDYSQKRNHYNRRESSNQGRDCQKIENFHQNRKDGYPGNNQDNQQDRCDFSSKAVGSGFGRGKYTNRADHNRNRNSPQQFQDGPSNTRNMRGQISPSNSNRREVRSDNVNKKELSPNYGRSDAEKIKFRDQPYGMDTAGQQREGGRPSVHGQRDASGNHPFSTESPKRVSIARRDNDNLSLLEQSSQSFRRVISGAVHTPAPDIPFGVTVQARRVAGLSLADFGVIPLHMLEEFKILQRDLQKEKKCKKEILDFGDYCAVKYQLNDNTEEQWYRGIITSEVQKVGIYFVDLGIMDRIEKERVYELPQAFSSSKPLAIRLTCLNLDAEHGDKDVQRNFEGFLAVDKDIKIKITHVDEQEPFMYAGNVYVWHLEKWFDVAALLTNFGLAEIVPPETIKSNENQNIISKKGGDEFGPAVLVKSGLIQAKITRCKSVFEFYVTEDLSGERGKIERQLSRKHVQINAKRVNNLRDLSFPLFMYSDQATGKTVRAKVLETDGSTALIQNCDYADSEHHTVPITDLYQLPEEFHSNLPYVYKCSLPFKQPSSTGLSLLDSPNQTMEKLVKVPLRVKILKSDKKHFTHIVEIFLKDAKKGCALTYLEQRKAELLQEIDQKQLAICSQ